MGTLSLMHYKKWIFNENSYFIDVKEEYYNEKFENCEQYLKNIFEKESDFLQVLPINFLKKDSLCSLYQGLAFVISLNDLEKYYLCKMINTDQKLEKTVYKFIYKELISIFEYADTEAKLIKILIYIIRNWNKVIIKEIKKEYGVEIQEQKQDKIEINNLFKKLHLEDNHHQVSTILEKKSKVIFNDEILKEETENSNDLVLLNDFELPDSCQFEKDDLFSLIITSESMDKDESQYWFDILPSMNSDQINNLFNILNVERKKLEEVELKYQEEIKDLNEKHLEECKEFTIQEERKKRDARMEKVTEIENNLKNNKKEDY